MVDRDSSPLASHEVRDLAESWGISRVAVDVYSRLHAAHLGGDVSPSPSIVDDAPSERAEPHVAFFAVDRETAHGVTARMSRSVYVF
jgi:hypothetical protein